MKKYIPQKSDLITIDEKRGMEIVTPRPENKYQKQFIDLFSNAPKRMSNNSRKKNHKI